jgi:hypothetical protein
MNGWRGAEGNSGGPFEFRLAGFLPVEQRQLGDLLVGRRGQALQDVFEIGIGFDAVQPAVLIRVYITALRAPASSEPKKSQFFLPMAVGRMAFSTRLLSISTSPCSRKRSSVGYWLSA